MTDEAGTDARALVAQAKALRSGISQAVAAPSARLRTARAAYEMARDDVVRQQLATLPLARLKETTQGRLRLGVIEAAYVRRSELKDQSPDAVDVSDLKAAEEVGTQVEAERRIIEMERKRLRMEAV